MRINRAYPLLVIDAGNSAVKFAVQTGARSKPRLIASVATRKLSAARVKALWKKSGAHRAAAACVVPDVARILRAACPRIALIGPRSALNFATLVDRRTVGADRLANMAEAARRHEHSVIVASFGTAATFDILDADGRHAGGAIAPGFRTLAGALEARAALLPGADEKYPRRWAGRNTREALRAGVAGGYAGMVKHLIEKLSKENFGKRHHKLVFTGGDARTVRRLTGLNATVDPLWTLRGIAALADGPVPHFGHEGLALFVEKRGTKRL